MDSKTQRIEELRTKWNQLAPRSNELCDYGRNPNPPPEYYEVQRQLEEVALALMDISPFYKQCFYNIAQKYGRV